MKLLGVGGSKRKHSNSKWMLEKFLDFPENKSVTKEILLLKDYKIEYCIGCDECKDNGGNCVIKDDMWDIYPKLLTADVIILSSPNYFKNISALMKNFMDRTNSFVRTDPRLLKNKYAVGLSVGGEELQDTRHCEDAMLRYFRGHKMNTLVTINARADKPNSIINNKELEKSLHSIGKLISLGIYDNMFLQIPVQSQARARARVIHHACLEEVFQELIVCDASTRLYLYYGFHL